jgi:antitoxin (DNA-binding transcriptional repressor) of toxin-antitoxin stability system
MQVVLGTPASKKPLDEFIPRVGSGEIEIVAADGTALAYLVPAVSPDHKVYAAFERVFQSHADTLRRRAANPVPGITTAELFARLDALAQNAE